ncbi:MAG TPA: hypothetical protein VIL42_04185 [Sphingomicrobium sp.]|jgi:hypothetical protein
MIAKIDRKPHGRGGFKELSFDEAFDHAVEEAEIAEELQGPLTDVERGLLAEARKSLANRLTPAFRQSSGPFKSMVRREAKAWMSQHGGAMPNISEFIRHFQSSAGPPRACIA